MDRFNLRQSRVALFKRYRSVILIFLAGLFLLTVPADTAEEPVEIIDTPAQKITLQDSLVTLISEIDGAGKTEVLLTEASGEQIHYQTNDDTSSSANGNNRHADTVLVSGNGREETGLIRRVDPPVYQGAVVVCQGANNPQVRLAIVEAVSNATGLTTDKITVLKMK